jgi:small GTP-binding protein
MIQKKICMLGSFAVGKTSLVARFVRCSFSEKCHTTVGVKIDKKQVLVEDKLVNLILWDLYGEDEFEKVHMSYLRGAAGYLLVVDGTRRETVDKALRLQQRTEEAMGKLPFVVMLNKVDLRDTWEVNARLIEDLTNKGWPVFQGSAKTGLGVEDAFAALAKQML